MQVTGTVAALAVGLGLTGCASNGVGGRLDLAEDGARCDRPTIDGRVHVTIRYAPDGTPSAVPEVCKVARGTRITWRGPDGDATPFVLEFTQASPAGRGQPLEIRSGRTTNGHSVVIVADNAPGTYKYGIQANGITVDPAIIIDR